MAIPCSIISEHPLAHKFIGTIVGRHSDVRTIPISSLERISHREQPAVVVVDRLGLAMPLTECVRRVRLLSRVCRFLVVDQDFSKQADSRLLYAGFDGVMLYRDADNSLVEAIRRIHHGGTWIPSTMLISAGSTPVTSRSGRLLTTREQEVLELFRQKRSNREIGETLDITQHTVKFHLANLRSKLEVDNRHELMTSKSRRVTAWGTAALRALTNTAR